VTIFDNSFTALDKALGAAGMRQQALSNNVANVNTPLYKRQDVNFDGLLAKALDAQEAGEGDASELDSLTPTTYTDNTSTMRADGNNVDIDNEMSLLAQNNVRYNALVQLSSKKLNMLEYVISEGRR
jgi:flagellar basal-body rod protein FlgB